eukprot:TRINITY_DN80666_c0_g1_i1.p2 TRINITY_DN80666_c0_g1~~TRINITY_DN80666_c0_g1_i1.p2  ORF type:complete len:157 (+),score=29.55 TRINITY_DN80666_c0_g1_i1:116-586(+)
MVSWVFAALFLLQVAVAQQKVCGSDGKIYWNSCFASCAKVDVSTDAMCMNRMTSARRLVVTSSAQFANAVLDLSGLVCDGLGNSYLDECNAACVGVYAVVPCDAKVQDHTDGKSPDPPICFCSPFYSPVCGVNGRTYANACYVGCDHIPVAHSGRC